MGVAFQNLPAPPGFQGLHPDKPVTLYMRHLPHWRQDGAIYFVTFRQADSLPHEKIHELIVFRREWEIRHPSPRTEEQWQQLSYETMRRVEQSPDQGTGSCRLRDKTAATIVADALVHFDGERFELGCYVVMPNHVHAIVRPFGCDEDSLGQVLKSWKGYTGRRINQHFGLEGSFWQKESFDRIIRDEEHLYRAIQYIGANPTKSGLSDQTVLRWIRPEWAKLGWRFEEG
jgi:putative transposase